MEVENVPTVDLVGEKEEVVTEKEEEVDDNSCKQVQESNGSQESKNEEDEEKTEKTVKEDSVKNTKQTTESDTAESNAENGKKKSKEDKSSMKVIVRRLPPSMTKEIFMEQVSPLPPVDYFYFVPADLTLGVYAFSRAYLTFTNKDDLLIFTEKFDGYVFLDVKGQEYPAVVEFAPFQRIPKIKPNKKKDPLMGTIESDPTYIAYKEAFLAEALENSKPGATVKQHYFETEETTTQEEVNSTPLLDFLKQKRAEKARIKEERREEKKRKEAERKLKQRAKEKKAEAEEEETSDVKVTLGTKQSLEGGKEGQENFEKARSQTDALKRFFGLLPSESDSSKIKVLQPSPKEKKEGKEKEPKIIKKREKEDKEKNKEKTDTRGRDSKNRSGKYFEEKARQLEKKKPGGDSQESSQGTSGEKKVRVFESKTFSRTHENDKAEGDSKKPSSRGFSRKEKKEEFALKKERRAKEKAEKKRAKVAAKSFKGKEEDQSKPIDESQPKEGGAGEVNDKKELSENKTSENKEQPRILRRNSFECKGSPEAVPEKQRRSSLGDTASNTEVKTDVITSSKAREKGKEQEKSEKPEKTSKDPRTERRIRNKDRPSIEIYRPGMGRFSKQRLEKEKAAMGSSTEVDSPSHSPSPSTNSR